MSEEAGAFGFGLVIGWFLYFVNRYRRSEASFTDLTTIIGAVGGAAVTRLFSEGSELFGAYGLGLAVGFFTYFIVLVVMVAMSENFGVDYFLDGRRRGPDGNTAVPPDAKQPAYVFDTHDGGAAAIQVGVTAGIAAAEERLKQGTR